ncbi:MAG TPA: glycosyltransferase family 4 protein [Candidatus Paceibacterota bacterium]|nr:glycosyltransferase family 4 protein [Candidatus Paceibacterota bacterium]
MRVLIATGLFPPDIGGPATYSAMLLRELPKRGIAVSVASFGRVRHYPPVIRHIIYFFYLLVTGFSADIIYAQDTMSVGWPAYFANLFLRRRFFVRVPGDHVWEQGVQRFKVSGTLDAFPVFSWRWNPYLIFLRMLQMLVVRGAHRVIVPSGYLKRIVETWGVAPSRIAVIYNSYALPSDIEEKPVLRERLGLEGTVLVSVGRLVPWKGFGTLIELMPALERFFPDIRLLIIGDGPERSALDKKIQAARLGDKVSLLGRLPQHVAFNYVRAADLFVLNTSYEGFSHQLVEVMSVGTPIVTTNVGGNPELITHRESGLLVPYDDRIALLEAVKEVLKDKALAKRLAENATERLTAFDERELVDALAAELKTL